MKTGHFHIPRETPTAESLPPGKGRKLVLKKALNVIGGPLLRLHHYRDVRTKLMHDVLAASETLECTPTQVTGKESTR